MEPQIDQAADKNSIFEKLERDVNELGLKIADTDKQKPWGGWVRIDDGSTEKFLELYFPEIKKDELNKYGKLLRPKYLLISPKEILSWQYHNRRAEIWRCIEGPVGIMVSDSDTIPDFQDTLKAGELAQVGPGVRHRLVGLDGWGLIAEIWQHTDPDNPSEEDDIIRLEDDYGREATTT